MGTIWRCNIGFCSKNPNFHLFHDLEKLKSPDSPFKNSGISLWKTWKFSPRRTLKKSQFWINGWIGKIYLNPIKFRAPLIFAQLNNSYICARIIFAHWQNLYFRVSLSYDWKYSARHCVQMPKYGKIPIRFCPHNGKYGSEKAVFWHIFRKWENRNWMVTNKTGV